MNKITIKDLTLMAMLLAILILCSKLTIPLGASQLSLQTLSLALIGYLLKPKKTLIVVTTYIIIGLIGIPVFTQGGGFSYIVNPLFGFILGFIPFTLLISLDKKKIPYLSILALVPLYVIGALYVYLIRNFYVDSEISLYNVLYFYII
ncbi:MAG: biotin transporter BioY, partial [bacterium]